MPLDLLDGLDGCASLGDIANSKTAERIHRKWGCAGCIVAIILALALAIGVIWLVVKATG